MKAPGYQSIARIIRERILSGRYIPGERIPSIRQFAGNFKCNKLTVHRAFETLKQEDDLRKAKLESLRKATE